MIVVTTPTGAIGHQVLENLLEKGESVRVIVRDPSKLPENVREGVEVVQGSHGDAAVVDAAFEGADALFWVIPPDFASPSLEATYLDFARPACEAIKKHGVKRVVTVSCLGRGTQWEDSAGLLTVSLQVDDMFAATGAHLRALANPGFMDNILRQVEPIKNQGIYFGTNPADLKVPTCATKDIAAVGTKWLLDDSWTGRYDVPVLGPEDLSPNNLAEIMSEVLGKPVRYQQVPVEGMKAQMRQHGASEPFLDGYVAMMDAKDAGIDNAVARTAENSTPTTFKQWCEEKLKPAILK